jgi:hypothetical protein
MRTLFVSVFVSIVSFSAGARDIYLVQGAASGAPIGTQLVAYWSTNAFFYNTGETEARVTLLDVSNGGPASNTRIGDSFEIPPHASISLVRAAPWHEGSGAPLWVLHLDAPDTVLVEDVLFIGSQSLELSSPGTFPFALGKARLPVFYAPVPANQQQIHLATGLGPASDNPIEIQVSSRLNVAIYNAGAVTTSAIISIRQHCDDQIVTTRTVTIPANTILQVGGFEARTHNCLGDGERLVYTVVTADQPSVSFVSNLSNATMPTTSISIVGSSP